MPRAARVADDDDDDDLPLAKSAAPDPWDNAKTAAEVRAVLGAFDDVPPIDDAVRLTLQRQFYRREKYFGGDRGETTLLIRTILESTNGPEALVEPIVSSVSSCMKPQWTSKGLAWIEAFDQIPLLSLRGSLRDLFGEKDVRQHLETVIRRKLYAILEPAQTKPQAKVKLPPKPPRSLTRIPAIEANIAIGIKLQALRAQIKSNRAYGEQVRARFDIDAAHAVDCARVAKAFAARPEIYRAASWITLVELSSPKMSPSVRKALEAQILAGEAVSAPQIRHARGPLRGGSPKRPAGQPAVKMAA